MRTPFLIAQTPRAPGLGHRYLIPEGVRLSDSEVAGIVADAETAPEGPEYLAAVVDAPQKDDRTGTVREGKELIVLVGADIGRLSPGEKASVRARLFGFLANLATLVTREIEWERCGHLMVVERRELNEWSRRFADLPTRHALGRSNLKRRWFLGGAGLLVALLAVLGAKACFRFIPGEPEPREIEKSRYEVFLSDMLAANPKLSAENLPNVLRKEMGWEEDQTSEHDRAWNSVEVQDLIDKVYGLEMGSGNPIPENRRIHTTVMISDLASSKPQAHRIGLGSLIGTDDNGLGSKKVLGLRKSLVKMCRIISMIRKDAEAIQTKWGSDENPLQSERVHFLRWGMVRELGSTAKSASAYGCSAVGDGPKTQLPFFTEADWHRADMLRRVLLTWFPEANTLKQALNKLSRTDMNRITDEKRRVLAKLSGYAPGLRDDVESFYRHIEDLKYASK